MKLIDTCSPRKIRRILLILVIIHLVRKNLDSKNRNLTKYWVQSDNEIFQTTTDSERTIRSPSSLKCHDSVPYSQNSDKWLQGPRLSPTGGNHLAENDNELDSFVEAMMDPNLLMNQMKLLTDQTICHAKGRFRKGAVEINEQTLQESSPLSFQPSSIEWNISDEKLVKEWEIKLTYLSIHSFFHKYARDEYQERKRQNQCNIQSENNNTYGEKNTSKSSATRYHPHLYEYECKEAKYIVTTLPQQGIGVNLRLAAVSHILLGIALNRIPIFVFKNYSGPTYLNKPWLLSSCSRRSTECVFLPLTPCTILKPDLRKGTALNATAARKVRMKAKLDPNLDNERIIILPNPPAKTYKYPNVVSQIVSELAMELIQTWNTTINDRMFSSGTSHSVSEFDHQYLQKQQQQQLQVLTKAAEQIMKLKREDWTYMWISEAILLYVLRPNHVARTRIDDQLKGIFPSSLIPIIGDTRDISKNISRHNENKSLLHNSNLPTVIGMPIRGSDKCIRESTCLEFDKYMELANETYWNLTRSSENHNSAIDDPHHTTYGTLIMTTEDKSIFSQRHKYSNNTFYPQHYDNTITESSTSSSSIFPLNIVVNENDPLQGTGRPSHGIYKTQADDIMISSLVAMKMQFHSTSVVYFNCCSNFHRMMLELHTLGCGLVDAFNREETLRCLQDIETYRICCSWTRTSECSKIRKEAQNSTEAKKMKKQNLKQITGYEKQ